MVAGSPIHLSNQKEIAQEVMRKAYDIIDLKGATYFGIGACVASLCQSILLDQKTVRPISVYHPKYQTVLSWPCVVGSLGAERLVDVPLNAEEVGKLEHCAELVRTTVASHK